MPSSNMKKTTPISYNKQMALACAAIRHREALRKKSIPEHKQVLLACDGFRHRTAEQIDVVPVYDIVYHDDILSVEDFEQLYSMLSDSIHLLMQAKPKKDQVLIYRPLLTKSMNLATHGWPEYVKISEIPSLIENMYKKRSDFTKYYCSAERILNEKKLEKIEQEFQEEWAERPRPSDLYDPYYG
jgi:hypothetical protein